ncbi:DUF262 domain-containing protein [Pseudooceanicola sp. CBS1P-1]|uniref:DUF262 domain-containing protein n=1 Tax=Pseudooceanicola albus TaxID=2692189 RepID=A0A6L7GB70_9RHOB|nr:MULTISPECIES: DUF262 domain-containing protein [Pseudooceanicola]MBT9387051.1 DUF262 domain-containing protein [Pseudooceanicola endophyticus]MXN21219.1 DUF262 domain-containing protein [Pseudooceanicola albus]
MNTEVKPDISLQLEKTAEDEYRNTLDEAQGAEPIPPADIVSYNELRSCADLFRLFDTDKLEIQPDFQREVVWKPNDQSRFIDSLVKQLPIPSMCFSLDYKTQKWKVIDGLQRMSSIISFLSDQPWRLRSLEDIHPLLRGSRNIDLKNGNPDQQRLFTTVQDVSIPITVLRCDYSQPAHMQYLFTIFHRLNSGGVRLNNQEIRNCIYTGSFNTCLKEFDSKDPSWIKIKKRIWGSANRFRSVELLLRALALTENLEEYDGNLARFLNNYMHERAGLGEGQIEQLQTRLEKMSQRAVHALGSGSTKISMTFIEATLVGVLSNLNSPLEASKETLHGNFLRMMRRDNFAEAARYAVASEANVKSRLAVAIEEFKMV